MKRNDVFARFDQLDSITLAGGLCGSGVDRGTVGESKVFLSDAAAAPLYPAV